MGDWISDCSACNGIISIIGSKHLDRRLGAEENNGNLRATYRKCYVGQNDSIG